MMKVCMDKSAPYKTIEAIEIGVVNKDSKMIGAQGI